MEFGSVSEEFLPAAGQRKIIEERESVVDVITELLYDKYVHNPPGVLLEFCEIGGTPSNDHDIDFDFEKEVKSDKFYRLSYLVNFVEIILTGCPDQPMVSSRRGHVVVIYDSRTHGITFEAEKKNSEEGFFRDDYGY